MPLPCTKLPYGYTDSNTTVSTTKCHYFALHQDTVTQTPTQRYLPQSAVTLHYTCILLHKHQHNGVHYKIPLPCTRTVYCYTNTTTTVSTTKCHYLALQRYNVTQTLTQRYLPQSAVTLHYTSILLHKHQQNGVHHKIPLPSTTPVYCYTNTNTTVFNSKCRYLALYQYIVTQKPTQRCPPQNPVPCTTLVYCYTNTNTTVSPTKCRYLALHQYTVTQTATQRYLPQNAVNLQYTTILLHKHQHNGIYHKIPLPCTTPVYCYTNTNTAVSTTKCRYLALHRYTVTHTPTQLYLPQNAVTLHYNSILLHKHQHSSIYHKMLLPCTTPAYCYTNTNTAVSTTIAVTLHYTSIQLHKQQHSGIYHKMQEPCTTPVYCYTNTNTAVSTTKCRYLALHQYTVTRTPTQRYLPQNAVTLHYTGILLHKHQHSGIYHKMPLPCTTPVYCYTNTNTTLPTTKCRYLALRRYTVAQTPTQQYLPQNAVTLHYNSILLHKHQHSSIYHKMPLPCTTPVYC